MSRYRFVFPLVLLAAFYFAPSVHAGTYWISPQGNDSRGAGTPEQPWKTVSHAIRAVPDDGSTIIVRDGLYAGVVSASRHFREPCTVRAEHPYQARFSSPRDANRVFYLAGLSNLVFHGLECFGSGATKTDYLVQISTNDTHHVRFENCIIHDSYKNDLIKINSHAHEITFSGCVFFNQADHGGDEHFDINTVRDITIEDSIFFNDYPGSGRPETHEAHSFLVVKNSGTTPDVTKNIVLRRNIFLGWSGKADQGFLLLGEDGKPFFEAQAVLIENNLFLHHTPPRIVATFLFKGGLKNVTVRANTITGAPHNTGFSAFGAVCLNIGENPKIDRMLFANNLFCNQNGAMPRFSSTRSERFTENGFKGSNNLYWNAGKTIPSEKADVFTPQNDLRAVLEDPKLPPVPDTIVYPRFDHEKKAFLSGNRTIREEFVSLVETYAVPAPGSAAMGKAEPATMPKTDILGRRRHRTRPDIGCFETTRTIRTDSGSESDSDFS